MDDRHIPLDEAHHITEPYPSRAFQELLRAGRAPHRFGDWTQTYTGGQFWPMDALTREVNICDIAHALSQLCRYNGHTHTFYSVAEHSILLSHAVNPRNALWALLHDATEAYIGDMVRPLKKHLPDYIDIEHRLMTVIAQKFHLEGDSIPQEVLEADTRIILDERAALLDTPPDDWGIPGPALGVKIRSWDPSTAEQRFLDRFEELTDPDFEEDDSSAALRQMEDFTGTLGEALATLERLWDTDYGQVQVGTDDADENTTQYVFVTGGWSRNEGLLAAARKHPLIDVLAWESSQRGGRHVYKLSQAAADIQV